MSWQEEFTKLDEDIKQLSIKESLAQKIEKDPAAYYRNQRLEANNIFRKVSFKLP